MKCIFKRAVGARGVWVSGNLEFVLYQADGNTPICLALRGCGNGERGIFLIQDALLMPLFWLGPPCREADSSIGSSQEDWQQV